MTSIPVAGVEARAAAKAALVPPATGPVGRKGSSMKWVITIETTKEDHSHIDVDDPDTAAVVINEINDARATEGQRPAHARLDSYTEWWECGTCGAFARTTTST